MCPLSQRRHNGRAATQHTNPVASFAERWAKMFFTACLIACADSPATQRTFEGWRNFQRMGAWRRVCFEDGQVFVRTHLFFGNTIVGIHTGIAHGVRTYGHRSLFVEGGRVGAFRSTSVDSPQQVA
ncbi:hypothetical protein MRX96_036624 [Rhipicephalus microplus]